jgi:hypothetical protein
MTEHEERLCPRCGHPAGDHRFWPACGLNIDSLSETPVRAEHEGDDVSHEIGQETREAVWSEDASGAESNGGDQIPGEAWTAPVYEIDCDRGSAEDTPAEAVTAPLKATLVVSPAEQQPSDVSHEIGHETREALWSEDASGVESNSAGDQIPGEASTAPIYEIDSDRGSAEDTSANVDPASFRDRARPGAQRNGSRSVVRVWMARGSRSQRLALVCLLVAIGLVVVLTGRDVRRYI